MKSSCEQPGVSCILCSSRRYERRYDFRQAAIWRCVECGMMALWPMPTAQGLRSIYDDKYYKNEQFLSNNIESLYGYVDYLTEKRHKRLDMKRIIETVRSCLPGGAYRPSLLEIGCGLGLFLDAAHDGGFEVEGIEFNRYAYDFVRGKYQFPVSFGSVTDVQCLRPSYDVCCMLDVIEHLLDPLSTMERVGQLVRPGGLVVLQTMDSTSFVSRLLGRRLEDFRRIREHLFFFDRRTIRRLLEKFGFEVQSIRSIGHTFELGFALDRFDMVYPGFRFLKRIIWPRWLLDMTLYFNPGTKMLVIARKK